MTETAGDRLGRLLEHRGWTVGRRGFDFLKGNWRVFFDTSSWMILETEHNPRTMDVAVPDDYRAGWTVNLIEHLASMEDERHRLRAALTVIRDDPASGPAAQSVAAAALTECYHGWLLDPAEHDSDVPADASYRCPICGARRQRRRTDMTGAAPPDAAPS